MNALIASGLWQHTLATMKDDPHEKHRERLRASFSTFHNKAEHLVGLITKDVPDYTVHDITHLDALWEIASTIAGDDYQFNPAEAFVLGGAILLHDAAMCLAAYPGGMRDLQKTPAWRDSVALLLSAGGKTPTSEDIASPPQEIAHQALQETLRLLHAQKARAI